MKFLSNDISMVPTNLGSVVNVLGVVIPMGDLQSKVLGRVEGSDPHLEIDRQLLVAYGVRLAICVLLASGCCLSIPRPFVDAGAARDVVLLHGIGVMPVD